MSDEDSSSGDKVVFHGVPGSYRPGENITVRYSLEEALSIHQRDWVGLFRVGWTSNRDYYTFEWAPAGKEEEGRKVSLKFSGIRLPPDDGHFYQFCYVSRNGMVRGASRPFQFTKEAMHKDDLELVEVDDDGLILLQTQHESEKAELNKTVKELTLKNEAVEVSFMQVKGEFENAQEKLSESNRQLQDVTNERDNLVMKVNENFAQHQQEKASLERQLNALQMALADKEMQVSKESEAKDATVEQLQVTIENLQKGATDKDSEIVALREQIVRLQAENKVVLNEKMESETQLRIQCSRLEERLRTAEEEKESAEGSCEYYQAQYNIMERKNEDTLSQLLQVQQEKDKLLQELTDVSSEKQELLVANELKDQEVNVMRQNLCEMMGTINEPRDELPVPPENSIDKSAIEALQLAYDDLEKRYNAERKGAIKLKVNLAECQERVRRCGMEYEKLVKQSKKVTDSVEVETVQRELEQFQLKHDERIAEKNMIIEQHLATIEGREEEIKQLKHREHDMKTSIQSLSEENAQLRAKIQQRGCVVSPSLTPVPVVPTVAPPAHHPPLPPHSNDRVCPVCNARFPLRMKQEEFEAHVNAHFP